MGAFYQKLLFNRSAFFINKSVLKKKKKKHELLLASDKNSCANWQVSHSTFMTKNGKNEFQGTFSQINGPKGTTFSEEKETIRELLWQNVHNMNKFLNIFLINYSLQHFFQKIQYIKLTMHLLIYNP